MSTPSFRFKQFTVWHDQCAMKVGTDGVLLGAWAFHDAERTMQRAECHILDIGTGTGLIALMLAQRWSMGQTGTNFSILGIDIDDQAVLQARDNFAASPWTERLKCEQMAVQNMQVGAFDYIISNPPYFINSLRNPDPARLTARHTDSLSYAELIDDIARLMREDGTAALILPAEAEIEIISLATKRGLCPTRMTRVCSKPGRDPKRILIELRRASLSLGPVQPTTFYIESAHSPRSEEYAELTREFYL